VNHLSRKVQYPTETAMTPSRRGSATIATKHSMTPASEPPFRHVVNRLGLIEAHCGMRRHGAGKGRALPVARPARVVP